MVADAHRVQARSMDTTTSPDPGPSDAGPAAGAGPRPGPRVSGEQMRDLGRLRRSTHDRKVGGVCAGIARQLDIDPVEFARRRRSS